MRIKNTPTVVDYIVDETGKSHSFVEDLITNPFTEVHLDYEDVIARGTVRLTLQLEDYVTPHLYIYGEEIDYERTD